jgi:hypothetical protein
VCICGCVWCCSRLELVDNSLQGRFDFGLKFLTALTYMDLSRNQFIGSVPNQWVTLTNMRHLDLHDNNLGGPVPKILTSMTALSYINLCNGLNGASMVPLPQWSRIAQAC